MTIRTPAVAGLFYPAEAAELASQLDALLAGLPGHETPKALIVPHAGYPYSGPVAASGYARLKAAADRIERVVLLGPSHRVPFQGLAASTASAFATPLGQVPVDREAVVQALALDEVQLLDAAHGLEHSLEVQLPFLQTVLQAFTLVPLVVGDAEPDTVAGVLDTLWGGPETLVVISSDLSHYQDYATAQVLDRATTEAIEGFRPEEIGYEHACGRNPINGLLVAAKRRGLTVQTLDQRNSGDTAGPRDRVVGYGSYAFH